MLPLMRARVSRPFSSRTSVLQVLALGVLTACSYDFGGPGAGGAGSGGSTSNVIYVTSSGSGSTAANASSGGPATSAANATTDTTAVASTADASSVSTGNPQPVCGNGVVEDGEDCEPGGPFGDSCGGDCRVKCGGGHFSKEAGLCYLYGGDAESRDDAITKCQAWFVGAELAILDTQARHEAAASVMPAASTPFIGAHNEQGNWRWTDGSDAGPGSPYSAWAVSCAIVSAIFGTGGDCAIMVDLIDDKWCSADCSADSGYVCQWLPQ